MQLWYLTHRQNEYKPNIRLGHHSNPFGNYLKESVLVAEQKSRHSTIRDVFLSSPSRDQFGHNKVYITHMLCVGLVVWGYFLQKHLQMYNVIMSIKVLFTILKTWKPRFVNRRLDTDQDIASHTLAYSLAVKG